ncbi:sensor domain-containing diguanylate cyclase [Clostridium beijerinckii]|uniref:GGDEF domain-containing protein n=3 Tax=Clostridium beijerinckii TaxID=1520 RepID=A0AAE2RUJ2_CLOBE|nr:sensor domain-containing diguanylate cyclase [Clostridium beijerinckii]ABR33270.1 diguanylate cyclase [Clostridium beijerinckii NCIMB 8052]AIU04226.1 diguanylate cyclase [Clostridium beijerinckii ATCC 35702]MBF7811832.1 GGDEF domain-containing protein [Clostridium beijerinckii]NRT25480.1 diguanylate cyclase (GGDEF)-like protein [Clostridium beijerinckii]NRT66925.1 diguanylate cyclase (GGDEF)-like protein [Clostridium beijerinckii]
MSKSFTFKLYLIFSTIAILMPTLFIILVQQKIIISFEKWEISNFIYFMFTIILLLAIIVNKIIRVYIKLKQMKSNLNIGDRKYSNDVKLIDGESLFNEIDKINRSIRILKFENSILYDTAFAIYNMASIQELLDTILVRLVTHTNADFGLIFLLEKDELKLKSHSNVLYEELEKTTFRIGEGLVGWKFYKGQGLLTDDVQKDFRYIRCISDTRGQITIPIKMHEKILGVLVLGSKKDSDFGESDFKLINTISGEIGLAINNAKLTAKLQKENQNNQRLFELTKRITSSMNLEEVSNMGIKIVTEIIEVHSCTLGIFDKVDENKINVISSYGDDKKGLEFSGTVEEAFKKKHMAEIKTDKVYIYSIPLLSKESCMGILHINTKNKLTIEEIELINGTITPLTSALENAFLYKNVERLATRDGLTGVYNHRYFQDMLDEYIIKVQKDENDLSMAMIDIDNFKKYNDTYGHPVGDLLLKKVVEVMRSILRDEDVIFRYGGDEFTIILPYTNSEDAGAIMEQIKNIISDYKFEIGDKEEETEETALDVEVIKESMFKSEKLFNSNIFKKWISEKVGLSKSKSISNTFNITISVGISSLVDVNYDKEMLIKNADKASLKSKRNGKNQVTIWKPELNMD